MIENIIPIKEKNMTLKNNLNNKYYLRLSLAILKDLRKSYMRIVEVRHNKKQWISNPELTKALEFFDRQIKEIYEI